ncbi:MAG: chemotaxis protein CheW [Halosimplex sp.]
MTDDERMDRARRIREMREGSRPNDEASTDDWTDGDDGGDSTDEPDSTAEAETDDGEAAVESDDGETAVESDDGEGTVETDDGEGTVETEGTEAVGEPDGGPAAVDSAAAAEEGAADDAGSESGTIHIPGADVGDVDVDVEEMARQAGMTSTASGGAEDRDADDADPEPGEGDVGRGATGAAGRATETETESGDETRVLEFALGSERYCLDIEYVEEIVKRETVTRVPNTPDCVEGVVDLRGQITTILDPKELLDIPEAGSKDLIVVFDPEEFDDQGAVGWVVDDVNQVTPITEGEVNASPVDQDHVNGVVDRDGEFVIYTTPELDIDEVAG